MLMLYDDVPLGRLPSAVYEFRPFETLDLSFMAQVGSLVALAGLLVGAVLRAARVPGADPWTAGLWLGLAGGLAGGAVVVSAALGLVGHPARALPYKLNFDSILSGGYVLGLGCGIARQWVLPRTMSHPPLTTEKFAAIGAVAGALGTTGVVAALVS
jgi:hypothetical protein